MSKIEYLFDLNTVNYNVRVIIGIEALNIHIDKSCQVITSKSMNEILDEIMSKNSFKRLAAAGFTRSKASLIREWKAHNILYRWGIAGHRTESVDLNQNESKFRRIGYFFLSLFFRG